LRLVPFLPRCSTPPKHVGSPTSFQHFRGFPRSPLSFSVLLSPLTGTNNLHFSVLGFQSLFYWSTFDTLCPLGPFACFFCVIFNLDSVWRVPFEDPAPAPFRPRCFFFSLIVCLVDPPPPEPFGARFFSSYLSPPTLAVFFFFDPFN